MVFDNTRRALASILAAGHRPRAATALIEGFWSYQVPGLAGLIAYINADLARTTRPGQGIPG